jgi:hypothetical protein
LDVTFTERPIDDPEIRCPNISRARSMLGWEPRIPLTEAFSERSNGPRRHGEAEHGGHQTILKDDHIWTLTETDQGPL